MVGARWCGIILSSDSTLLFLQKLHMQHNLVEMWFYLFKGDECMAYLVCSQHSPDLYYLRACYVEPQYRNLGIATWLLGECLRHLRGEVYGLVTPELFHLFEKFGFVRDKMRQDHLTYRWYTINLATFDNISPMFGRRIKIPLPAEKEILEFQDQDILRREIKYELPLHWSSFP